MSTRDKILAVSKNLFNEYGFGAVSLQSIADQLQISRGNLTYYFKNKWLLLGQHAQAMSLDYVERLRPYMFPTWENTYNATKAFHELQREYAFIFSDKQVLQYPTVKSEIKKIYEDDLKRQLSMITFSIEIGNMKPETIPGSYHSLVQVLWAKSFFWNMSEVYQEHDAVDEWEKLAWSLILPHFTDQGIEAFKKHFGESYYDSLGPSFESMKSDVSTF